MNVAAHALIVTLLVIACVSTRSFWPETRGFFQNCQYYPFDFFPDCCIPFSWSIFRSMLPLLFDSRTSRKRCHNLIIRKCHKCRKCQAVFRPEYLHTDRCHQWTWQEPLILYRRRWKWPWMLCPAKWVVASRGRPKVAEEDYPTGRVRNLTVGWIYSNGFGRLFLFVFYGELWKNLFLTWHEVIEDFDWIKDWRSKAQMEMYLTWIEEAICGSE